MAQQATAPHLRSLISRREQTLTCCPLTSTYTHVHTHTNTQINAKIKTRQIIVHEAPAKPCLLFPKTPVAPSPFEPHPSSWLPAIHIATPLHYPLSQTPYFTSPFRLPSPSSRSFSFGDLSHPETTWLDPYLCLERPDLIPRQPLPQPFSAPE